MQRRRSRNAGRVKVTTHWYPSMGFVGVVTRGGKHVFDGAPGRTRSSARKKALAEVRKLGLNPGNGGGKHVVARWESQKGKHWLELYRDQMGHTYRQDGGGGNLGGGLSDADAISSLRRGMLGAMFTDHPSTKRVKNPLPRWVHRKSIRTIYRGKGRRRSRILVGCPKRAWSVRRKRCRKGMRLVEKKRAKNGRWTKARHRMWRHGDKPTGSRGWWKKAERLKSRFLKLHRLRRFRYREGQRKRVSNKRRVGRR